MTSHAPALLTESLAEFVAGFTPDRLPASIQATTQTVVRDGTGCLLAAANPVFSTGRLITSFVADQGGKPEASVVGAGFKTGAVHAALANGTMGYACDFEPHHPEAILHPIAVMIPTAMAVGQRVGASGARFLAAVALGCEVEYRVSMAIGPVELYNLGFHPSAVAGAFGATACAAFLLGLDREAVVSAFGLAGCQASGMMAWESDSTENSRPFQMGMAARNGVTAALLAGTGFGGPTAIFDHGHTIFHAFSRNPKPGNLLADLGSKWDGIAELAIKPYSSVSFLHPALDALFDILRETKIEAADVKRITLRFPKSGVHCVDNNPLKSHCAQYILPVALARGLEVADLFVDARETDPAVARLARCTEVVADEELDKLFPDYYASILEIETGNGTVHRRRQDVARGYPESPMSAAELDGKFEKLAGSVASPARVTNLSAAIAALPSAPEIDTCANLLCGRPGL